MKHIKAVLVLLVSGCVVVTQLHSIPESNPTISPYAMGRFFEVLHIMRKQCAKHPKAPICVVLHDDQEIGNDIDVQGIVSIGNELEKDAVVAPLAEKIEKRLKKNINVIHQCLAGNKKSCRRFERSLRFSTLRCGGLRCIWSKRPYCEAAAFAATTRCINSWSK